MILETVRSFYHGNQKARAVPPLFDEEIVSFENIERYVKILEEESKTKRPHPTNK